MHQASGGRYRIKSTTSCRVPRTASASRWSAGWPPGTTRWTSSASTSPGRRSSPRPAGSGSGRAATRRQAEEGTLRGPAADRDLRRTSSTPPRTTPTPSCSGTARTSCRRPPKTWDEMMDMAERPRPAGQAALHRDPGRPVRGPDRVVQHAARERRRQRPQRGRATEPSLGQPAVEALTIMRDLATSPAADPSLSDQMEDQNRLAMESADGRVRAQLPVRLSVDEGEQPEAVQELQVGAVPRRSTPNQPGHGHHRRHQPGRQRLLAPPRPRRSRRRCACATGRTSRSPRSRAACRPPSARPLRRPGVHGGLPVPKDILAALESASVRPLDPAPTRTSRS